MATDKFIVALDMDDGEEALALVRKLKDCISFYKVGTHLFTREGPSIVRALRAEKVDVFLDLKFHDIPQTVVSAVKAAAALETRFVTIHTSGGAAMMIAAAEAARDTGTQLLGVTVLTSLENEDLREIGFDHTVIGQVLELARLAATSGITGLVCSPLELELVRRQIKLPLTLVTPGIRGANDPVQDQKRTMTPQDALQRGATHLVIGRPITLAPDPVAAAKALLQECGL